MCIAEYSWILFFIIKDRACVQISVTTYLGDKHTKLGSLSSVKKIKEYFLFSVYFYPHPFALAVNKSLAGLIRALDDLWRERGSANRL